MASLQVTMRTGVGNTHYSYQWSELDDAHVTEGKEIINRRGDVDFLKRDGTRIIHPYPSILKIEVAP